MSAGLVLFQEHASPESRGIWYDYKEYIIWHFCKKREGRFNEIIRLGKEIAMELISST